MCCVQSGQQKEPSVSTQNIIQEMGFIFTPREMDNMNTVSGEENEVVQNEGGGANASASTEDDVEGKNW